MNAIKKNNSCQYWVLLNLFLLLFMNNGRIPRRQGQEILTDLIAMGY
jgi:hypothetical protein